MNERLLTKSQDIKTAKAVRQEIGEWLSKKPVAGCQSKGNKFDIYYIVLKESEIDALRKGEMPKE